MSRPIVVTGLGCLSAAGLGLAETMRTLYAGERRCGKPRAIQSDLEESYPVFEITSNLRDQLNGLASEFDLKGQIGEASRTSQLALAAALEACQAAALTRAALKPLRVGVCLGTTVGCTLNHEPFYRDFRLGRRPSLAPFERYLNNNPAQFLARTLGLTGPVATVANACASGADAIGMARQWLRAGLCDAVIAGGADELSRITYLGFIHLLITSPEPCRPFDRDRRGLNLGEGAGVMVLETETSARRRGAAMLAEAAGYGCAADAWHPTAPHPEGKGLASAISQALAEAGTEPEAIDFVNAHGTATPENDRIEGATLARLFPARPPVVSTKAYTGHTLGAAGGIEAVLSVQALLDRCLPATPGFAQLDPECAIQPTTELTPLKARTALSDSLAFGGGNSALIFRSVN